MKYPKKDKTGVFFNVQPSQKRKRKSTNDENDDCHARSQKLTSSKGVVFEEVTDIPHISHVTGNCNFLLTFT